MKRIVVVSDIQAPLHDPKMVRGVTEFIGDYQPDMIATVGDECDCTSIGRWVRGRAEEHTADLQKAIDATHSIMRGFREAAPNAHMVVQRSNHTTTRLENYIGTHAPALSPIRGLDWKSLMGYGELDIELSLQPTVIAPGWLMMHGDEGRSATYSGGTALKLANQVGESVVCGHTHKQGLLHDHDSHSGRITKRRFGFEVGHLMDLREASYIKAGANWQAGFGLLYVDGKHVTPTPIPIVGNRFTVEGKSYSWR